jgi:uncharacterized repeat protein (TIGR01451 family)
MSPVRKIQISRNLSRLSVLLALAVALVGFFALAASADARVGSPATECQNAFGPGYVGFKIEEPEASLNGSYTDPATGFQVTISNVDTNLHTFDYSSSWPVNVVVKGGPSAGNFYSPPASSGTGLHPPVNPNNGKFYGISHVTFCWNPNTPPPPGKAKLKIEKLADNPVVYENGQVVFTVTVRNDGTAAAENTVITDDVPAGLTVNSADSPCTVNVQLVTCNIGTLPAGQSRSYQIRATADPLPSVPGVEDTLDISKVEQHVSLQAGETRTIQLTCGPDGIMTDAAVRVDSVDQGTGNLNSVEVRRIESISPSTYEAEVTNHAIGQAQVKFFGVCVGKQTQEGRQLTVSAPVTKTLSVDAGIETLEVNCPAGTTPISPGYELTGTRGMLLVSAPVGSDTRKFTFKIDQDGSTAEISVRCLNNVTSEVNGSTTQLQFQPISKTIEVGAGQVVMEQLTCGVGYKGIVAGWEYPDGVVPLGNDPQPITRVFKIWNSTGLPQQVTLHLLCLSLKTGSTGPQPQKFVNTASVTSTTPQAPGAVLEDSAEVTVKPGSAPAPVMLRASFSGGSLVFGAANLRGKVSLVVRSANRVRAGADSIRAGAVIARSVVSGSSRVRVGLRPKAAKAIRDGSLKKVRVSVRTADGSTSRVLGVRR